MNIENKDPATDRKEFKIRLECIFDWKREVSPEELIEEIALNDGRVSPETKTKIQGCKDKVNGYLADWDAAGDQKGREAVVNGVKR